MFKWLTTTKKGFTLVELMITLLLLGLGFFAIVNIFKVSYKSYDKTEERYIKQEQVKTIVEYLQQQAKVASSTVVEVYDDETVIPPKDVSVSGYSYLYVEEGILYVRNSGAANGMPIGGEGGPLYIYIKPFVAEELEKGAMVKKTQCAIDICVCALDEDVLNEDGTIKETVVTRDGESTDVFDDDGIVKAEFIYYQLDVTYHFPNMVERGINRVNYNENKKAYTYKFNADGTYMTGDTNKVDTIEDEEGGMFVRFVSDTSLMFDGYAADTTVPTFCFIATASYGEKSDEVGLLCDFRDSVLLKTKPGTWFVHKYYELSPPIAEVIAGNDFLRAAVRTALKPLVAVAYVTMNPEWLALIVPATGVIITACVRAKKKRPEDE